MKPSEIWKNKQYKNKDKFGIYVKNRRKELGLTIKDFAEKLNLSPAYICDIENGKRLAPLGCLDKIVSTLKIEENEVNFFYDLVGCSHSNWQDLNEYFAKNPNAREFFRLAQKQDLSDEEVANLILSMRTKIDEQENEA